MGSSALEGVKQKVLSRVSLLCHCMEHGCGSRAKQGGQLGEYAVVQTGLEWPHQIRVTDCSSWPGTKGFPGTWDL